MTPAWLHAASAMVVVLGLIALVVPIAPIAERPVEISPAPLDRPPSDNQSDSSMRSMVRTNLFSATRQAPRVRFVLPGQEPLMVPMADPVTSLSTDAPELQGVLMVNGVRRALLRVPGLDSVPRVVQTGDRVGGYRVRAIGVDRVELASESGTRTVRLRRKFPSDSNGVEP
ncbi:hypothetical protein [Gemmatimonas phototrophica]|nr:hypothetical protein [Gemmatimonas phototrophica]